MPWSGPADFFLARALDSCQELTIPAYGSLSKSISVLCAFILAFSFINSKAMTTPVVVPNPSESVAAAFWRTSWLRKFDWLVLKQQDGGSERPFCKTCQKFLFQKTVGGGNLTSLLRHERTGLHQGKGPMKTSSVKAPPIQDFLDCLDDRAKRKSFRSSGTEKAWIRSES